MNGAVAAAAFLPGLAIGSFLNVVAARVPARLSIVSPGSSCPQCATAIAWYDNIPVVSYLLLRGRCRHCDAHIALKYPLVELTTAALVSACFFVFGLTADAAIAAFFCAVLVTITVTDLERRVIPNQVVLPAAALVLAARTAVHPSPSWAIAAAAGSLFLLLAALAYPGGLGMGDVKLAVLLGAALGVALPVGLMAGMLAALVPSIALLARHGMAARKLSIPLGPFLAGGAILALFAGHAILDAYLSLAWTGAVTDVHPIQEEARIDLGDVFAPGVDADPDRFAAANGNGAEHEQPPGGFRRRATDRNPDDPDDLERARQLAEIHGLPLVDLAVTGVSPEATKMVPLAVLERVGAIPYFVDEDTLRIALTDPDNVHGIDELRLTSKLPVEFAVAPLEDVMVEVRRLTRANVALGAVVDDDAYQAIEDEPDDLTAEDGISEGPIVRLVNSIIFQAAEDGASDVHFEPQEDALLVRFRVDGVLVIAQRIPRQLAIGVVTRLKVLAKLDIAERRKPQDGRITLGAGAAGRLLDIRVATLPTVYGESVVMRLLDKSRKAPTLEELGLVERMHEQLARIVKRPTGALLVTGPTGSGKSTTLYAALAGINNPEINIITVEDPVEYRLAGINQVQINQRAGLTFATVLRSILRSDPDVIMVGEIRDVETAKISIEAALTGHMVLSTLHTNDAPSALTRLSEMGVEPFLTASAVSAVLAQRLMRKLCSACSEPYSPTEAELRTARVPQDQLHNYLGAELRRKSGCTRCAGTGFKGRIGVFQLLEVTETIASLAARGANKDEIELAAAQEGMRTLWADGLEKVLQGVTTVEELARVVS